MFDIRCPVHRTISFSENEKRLVSHPFVQRLRYVRQLGTAYMAYPGATHDRFSHALGAMHVAGRMWDGMVATSGDVLRAHFSEDDLPYFRRLLRCGGLLHDIGHAPFSHMSERFMPPFADLELPFAWYDQPDMTRQAHHEDYSVMLIASMAADVGLLPQEAQDIASLVHHGVRPSAQWLERFGDGTGHKGIHALLRSVISGELDCDRADYLLRDAFHTGVAYGTHDIEHLVANMGVTELPGDGLVRTLDSTAVRAFEDFLLARYHMFLQVYFHKTANAFDHFLQRAADEGEIEVALPADAKGYAALRDSTFVERLFDAAANGGAWSGRFIRREPPRMLLQARGDVPAEKALLDATVAALDAAGVPHFRATSKQRLSAKPRRDAPTAMLVRGKRFGKPTFEPVETASSLLVKYNETIDSTHLYVLPEHTAKALHAVRDVGT